MHARHCGGGEHLVEHNAAELLAESAIEAVSHVEPCALSVD